ncbi:MAG: hypothetical protein HN576_06500 [Bacteriovoracaceae bacterium]|nr:hypothetical protein [Bacteriovoracaceae bacterium]
MKLKIILCFCIFITSAFGKDKKSKSNKVIIKYQKRQKVDLGELSVEGNVLTPGDILIDYDENEATMELHKRRTYKDKLKLSLDTTI